MASPLFEISGMSAGYGAVRVLDQVCLSVAAGEIVILAGRNGAGRSTLARAAMGLLEASGVVRLNGVDLSTQAAFRRARAGLGYVPERRDIFSALTVDENLRLGARVRRGHASRFTRDDVLQHFPPLARRLQAPAGALSGGEQQMLALCRSLLGDPDLLIADEPAEGVAPAYRLVIAECLRGLAERGMGILWIEQRLGAALDVATRIDVMGHGRIVYSGTPVALRERPDVLRTWLAAAGREAAQPAGLDDGAVAATSQAQPAVGSSHDS
ncbi:MAG: ABC transporter ATP-binding protein [Janthinobacterium lividum]